jgi:hypothetical protein
MWPALPLAGAADTSSCGSYGCRLLSCFAGAPFESFGYSGELDEMGACDPFKEGEHVGGCGVEELAAAVDLVGAAMFQVVVQLGFEGDGVFAEDEGVDVEPERDRGVA